MTLKDMAKIHFGIYPNSLEIYAEMNQLFE